MFPLPGLIDNLNAMSPGEHGEGAGVDVGAGVGVSVCEGVGVDIGAGAGVGVDVVRHAMPMAHARVAPDFVPCPH
jgi:hypothetical protein